MKIVNQKISGGNQQFADSIINNSKFLSEEDKTLLEIINENASSEIEKKKLVRSLEILKSKSADSEIKVESKSLLKKFFEEGVGEAGKEFVKGIISSGIWAFLLK